MKEAELNENDMQGVEGGTDVLLSKAVPLFQQILKAQQPNTLHTMRYPSDSDSVNAGLPLR